jgi:hypothetical protein
MTRGLRGCYIYCTDPETQEYFKNKINFKNSKSIYNDISSGASINFDK